MKNWTDKVNGYGVYFRFILPVMVTILGWSLNGNINTLKESIKDIKKNQIEVKEELISYQSETRAYNSNHLEHHRINEIAIATKLSHIETILSERK